MLLSKEENICVPCHQPEVTTKIIDDILLGSHPIISTFFSILTSFLCVYVCNIYAYVKPEFLIRIS